jgi:hypothetical protein
VPGDLTLDLAESGRLYLLGYVVGKVRPKGCGWTWELVDGRKGAGVYHSPRGAAIGAGVAIFLG